MPPKESSNLTRRKSTTTTTNTSSTSATSSSAEDPTNPSRKNNSIRRKSTSAAILSSSGVASNPPKDGSAVKKKPSLRKAVKRVIRNAKEDAAAMKALADAQNILRSINEPRVPDPRAPEEAESLESLQAQQVEDESPRLSHMAVPQDPQVESEKEEVIEEQIEVEAGAQDECVAEGSSGRPETPVVRGRITLEVDDFNHQFDIEDGILAWEVVDQRFGITSGEFDGVCYARQFGADFPRPMFLKSDLHQDEPEEVDEPFSRDFYFGLTSGETYVLRLPTHHPPGPQAPPKQNKCKLKFNHYCDEFPICDGELTWDDIDAKYAISFAYKGNYGRDIFDSQGNKMTQSEDRETYFGFVDENTYTLKITEDRSQALAPKKTYKADNSLQNPSQTAAQARSSQLTQDLKNLSTEELRAQTDRYKELLEARDIEDCLYG